MFRSKIVLYTFISLLVIIGGQYFYYRSVRNKLEQENYTLEEEKKQGLKKVRDSAFKNTEKLTIDSKKRFDSLLNSPVKIKWIKYEKPIYVDRNLDDALRIISDYEYNRKPTGEYQ